MMVNHDLWNDDRQICLYDGWYSNKITIFTTRAKLIFINKNIIIMRMKCSLVSTEKLLKR